MIDLGLVREVPPVERPIPYRAVLGALSLVLLALLSGAAHRSPARPPAIVPARLGDTVYLDGDRLFVVASGSAQAGETVQSWAVDGYRLPDARPLGRTMVTFVGEVTGVNHVGDVLVVTYRSNTDGIQGVVAQTVGGRTPLWRRAARMVAAPSADTVLLADATGEYAVDLRSGALRWRVSSPAGTVVVSSSSWIVRIADAGRIEVWDAHTGRLLRSVAGPPLAGRSDDLVQTAGDLILVNTGDGYDGYRLPGLERRWHTTADLSHSWMEIDCGTVICSFREPGGTTAVDPATGRQVWRNDRWSYAEPLGRYLLASAAVDGRGGVSVLWVIDPATGEPLGNFGDWHALGPAGDGLLYGFTDAGYRIYYGLLDPATRRIDYLGTADRVSGDCQTSGVLLVCRLVDASYAVWPLR
ncbi:outer membrane protein assembly factor BamB family protein [Paractinoplanes durhamensis]|uniref:Outer membrane protein assembly factor BamB n=1 Tax=Paractinoplanes durhamensis TaxID=113563 RepID=A0ABQ3YM93_9ACTN|nr:PQQ-binding-like beta-propeller repeat protein [Actinoplanes durhamensis]GID98706.1 hypothetical protein Adu01nite_00570 [Actinoplanes durhamensis]